MKITKIQVANFIGARSVDVSLDKPIQLFAGKNFAGKSSLSEAVRMALCGESVRVGLKKDYPSLVSEGQDAGFSSVEISGDLVSIVLPSGKQSSQAALPPSLPYVLDAQRFSHLSADDRRSFLFGLTGIKIGGDEVKGRLLKRQCDPAKVEVVLPILRAGFDAGMKEAQAKARDAKVQWKAVAGGETYGSVKAASFSVKKPEVDLELFDALRADLATAETSLADANASHGALNERSAAAKAQTISIKDLRAKGANFASLQDKLNANEAELSKLETVIAVTREKAGTKPSSVQTFVCPCCEEVLAFKDLLGAELIKHIAAEVKYDAEAAAALPGHEKALAATQAAIKKGKAEIASCEAAIEAVKAIENGALIEPPTDDQLKAVSDVIANLSAAKKKIQEDIGKAEEAQRVAAIADQKTDEAMQHHLAVAAWDKIADALSPSGIPGDLLAEALGPINNRLAQSAADTEWSQTVIRSDMEITASDRPYALLSESEKFRTDAMIAEAIGSLSGIKILVLDRVDVLDTQKGREDLLAWLDILASNGELDTALLFATLPTLPPDTATMQAHWIEDGKVAS